MKTSPRKNLFHDIGNTRLLTIPVDVKHLQTDTEDSRQLKQAATTKAKKGCASIIKLISALRLPTHLAFR